jgi:hypothetical protein
MAFAALVTDQVDLHEPRHRVIHSAQVRIGIRDFSSDPDLVCDRRPGSIFARAGPRRRYIVAGDIPSNATAVASLVSSSSKRPNRGTSSPSPAPAACLSGHPTPPSRTSTQRSPLRRSAARGARSRTTLGAAALEHPSVRVGPVEAAVEEAVEGELATVVGGRSAAARAVLRRVQSGHQRGLEGLRGLVGGQTDGATANDSSGLFCSIPNAGPVAECEL